MTLKNKSTWFLFGIIAVLMTVASFQDLAIDTALYHPDSVLANLVGAYGQSPVYWILTACLSAGWMQIPAEKKTKRWILGILVALIIAGLYVYAGLDALKIYPGWTTWLVEACLFFLPPIWIVEQLKNSSSRDVLRFMWFGIFIAVGQVILIDVLKNIWGRPRFWVLQEYPEVSFVNWWQPDSPEKATFMEALQIPSDGFKSFPSGHTASAACLLALTGLSAVTVKWKHHKKLLLTVALLGTAFVAFERMVLGMHFLSDVTMGFTITFVLYLIAWKCILTSGSAPERTSKAS